MKGNIKLSVSLFLNIVVVSIMCTILMFSIAFLNGELFKSGYKAYVVNEKGERVTEYTHYLSDGDDKKEEEYKKQGYTITAKVNITSKTGQTVEFITLTVLSLIILTVFVYNKLYPVGNKDLNAVRCGHRPEEKLRGLKVGIIAMTPDILFFITLVILRFAMPSTKAAVGYYKAINIIYFKLLNFAMGQGTLADVPVWGWLIMFAVLCIVPLIAHISYTFGYKDILISDKLTYKKGELK